MIFLISMQVPLARTNITDCYSSESFLNIKLNSYKLSLNLVPTNKSECHNFSQGVFVNLTLHATGYICNNISILVNNFTYANTTEIVYDFYTGSNNVLDVASVFCNNTLPTDDYLQGLPIMTFAFVQIYNHYQITTFEVMKQKQVKLQISGCFSSIAGVLDQKQNIVLTLVPLLTCRNLINNQTSNVNNYISEVSVLLNDQTFTLNSTELNTFINNYDAQKNITITLKSDSKTQQVMQASQVTSQIQLISMQNNVSVQVFYDINFSKSTPDFFGLNYYTQENYRLLVRYDSNNSETNLQGIQFSSYVIRLNLISGQSIVSYQQTINKSQYDIYNRIWEINCNEMIDYEQDQCKGIYDKIQQNSSSQVIIQIMFYDSSDQFLTLRQLDVIRTYNCFQNVRFTTLNNEIGYVQYSNVSSQLCEGLLKIPLENAGMVVSDDSYQGDLANLMILDLNPTMNNLTFSCSTEICKTQLFPRSRKSPTLLFTKSVVNSKIIYLVGFTNRATLAQGKLMMYVAVGVGSAILLGTLLSTLYEMVMTMRKVKLIKKKKLSL